MIKLGKVVRLRKLENLIEDGILTKMNDMLVDKYNECIISKKMKNVFESESRLIQIAEVFDGNTFLSEDNIVYQTDWIERTPLEERRVSLKNDKEKKKFYEIVRFDDIYTITLSNGRIYHTDEIDFDTRMFNVGDKVKLKDDVKFEKKYNGVTLTKTLDFKVGTVKEADDDNTVFVEVILNDGEIDKFWYGIDCLEKYEANSQIINDLSECAKRFNELESNLLIFTDKDRYKHDSGYIRHIDVIVMPNQSEFARTLEAVKEDREVIWLENSDEIEGGLALTFEETKKLAKYLNDYIEVVEKALDIEERQF